MRIHFLLAAVLLVWPVGVALAHDSFDEDHTHETGVEETPRVVLPEGYSLRRPVQTNAVGTDLPQTTPELAVDFPFSPLDSALDDDGDGLSNTDELRLGTNSGQADSDGDGFSDSLEIVRGYNPLLASPGDKIDFSTVDFGQAETNRQLKITSVRLETAADQSFLVVTGAGEANTVASVYIYSENPQVIVVRTDATGRFRLLLTDTLAVGEHEVYLALINASGTPVQVSEKYIFRKLAEGSEQMSEATDQSQDVPDTGRRYQYILLAAGGMGAVALLVIISLYVRHQRQNQNG